MHFKKCENVITGFAALALMFPIHKDVNAYTTVAQILGCIILAATIGVPVFLALKRHAKKKKSRLSIKFIAGSHFL